MAKVHGEQRFQPGHPGLHSVSRTALQEWCRCSPRKTQSPLILEVLGLAPSESGENNQGEALPAQCCWISYPEALTASGQSFEQREGKFSTFLPESGQETEILCQRTAAGFGLH